jgi:hypothetical protein
MAFYSRWRAAATILARRRGRTASPLPPSCLAS